MTSALHLLRSGSPVSQALPCLLVVILLLCIVAGVFVVYRVKYGLEYKGDWSAIPQFLVRRHPERVTGGRRIR